MKTVIKTTIKDNANVTVKESVTQVFDKLMSKGSFVLLTRVSLNKEEKLCVLRKSSIKMVK